MTTFLIKSTIAMGVLLGLYYILFEREKMHRFNRFYLISALVFSLTLPFITVITYIEKVTIQHVPVTLASATIINTPTEQPIDYWFYIGWIAYGIVTLVFMVRFLMNIAVFLRQVLANPSVKMDRAKLILLDEKVLPHTFLNFIFVNRQEHETRMIEDELYTHELTHVRQRHTLDILFIEALKTIFWFNPLLYFYKRAIQLNHEFLADENVIDTTANTVYYQNLLLEKATVGTTFCIASNLTFSLTKKRFLMMTKTTSTAKAGFLKLAIAPVITALMMFLCTETIAQQLTQEEADRQARIDKMLVPDKVMDSLKKANPEMFSDDLNIRYKNTKFTFQHKDGTVTEIIGYKSLNEKQKKLVSYAPEMYGMDLTIDDDEETLPAPVVVATTNEPGKDLNVLYKNTKFKFTDRDGNVAVKTGYRTLTEEDRKKIAPIISVLKDTDLIEYTETENGMNLHQTPAGISQETSENPQYPGGLKAFLSYFNANYNVPKIAAGTYKMYVSFIVEKDGSLSNIKCIKGDENLIKEAIRVIEKSEKWIPAQKDGVPIRASMNLPVIITVK